MNQKSDLYDKSIDMVDQLTHQIDGLEKLLDSLPPYEGTEVLSYIDEELAEPEVYDLSHLIL